MLPRRDVNGAFFRRCQARGELDAAAVWTLRIATRNKGTMLLMPGTYSTVRHDRGEDEVAIEEPLEIRVVGGALLDGLMPLGERILCVSGRLSFELVQKAAVAGAPILVGVGAPSSLAVSLAAERGLTLCGFARRGGMNVYTHPHRIRD